MFCAGKKLCKARVNMGIHRDSWGLWGFSRQWAGFVKKSSGFYAILDVKQ